jgi:lipoprotein YgeR
MQKKDLFLIIVIVILLTGLFVFPFEVVADTTHLVSRGETLWRISRNYNVSVEAIQSANPGLTPQTLKAGTIINIPTDSPSNAQGNTYAPEPVSPQVRDSQWMQSTSRNQVHVVEPGETLWALSRKYNISVDEIAAANGFGRETQLQTGQRVNIPGRGSSSPSFPQVQRSNPGNSSSFGLAWPLAGNIEDTYHSPVDEHLSGISIVSQADNYVKAAAPGEVIHVGEVRGYGDTVIVDHKNGFYTVYSCKSGIIQVDSHASVSLGTPLMLVQPENGMATLYFLLYDAENNVTVNPENYLR